jgi:hypothetical protein
MKQRHLLALIQNGYTTVQVRFDNTPKTYTYKARGHIEVGDCVIVDTPRNGLTLAHVVGVDKLPRIDIDADFTYKWIVQRVDRTEYDRTMEQEKAFMDTLQEIERVRQRDLLMQSFRDHLPEGSAARQLFDSAVSTITLEAK